MTRNSEPNVYGRGLALSTVKHVRQGLKAAFNYAVDEKLLSENPVSKTRLPALTGSSADSFTIEEALAFVSVKDDFWYGDAFIFQLHTGLRPQELMSLIWDDIDFKNGEARVERACRWLGGVFDDFGPPKSERGSRTINLAPDLLELLQSHKEKQQLVIEEYKKTGTPYGEVEMQKWVIKERSKQSHRYQNTNLIFTSHNGTLPNSGAPRRCFKSMLSYAEIRTGLRWYDLRHTHATFLLTMGVPEHEVAERMGHTTAQLQSTYAHVLQSRKRIASALFTSLIPVKFTKASLTVDAKTQIQEMAAKLGEHLETILLDSLGKSV